jgi:V8-like Glu-specific endopeptidase
MRRIPDDNLAYPVLIKIGASTGSGFFINTVSGTFLVTANHVIQNPQTGQLYASQAEIIAYPKINADSEKNIFSLDLSLLSQAGRIKFDSALDVALIQIGLRGTSDAVLMSLPPGVISVRQSQTGIVGVSLDTVRLYADVLISNDVFILGYPISVGIPDFPQIDYSKPLIRSGVVSGKNNELRSIILDCAVYPGNSGGPVIEVETEAFQYKYRVIGVVTQRVPTIVQSSTGANILVNSGYSVAASMDRVLELANEF